MALFPTCEGKCRCPKFYGSGQVAGTIKSQCPLCRNGKVALSVMAMARPSWPPRRLVTFSRRSPTPDCTAVRRWATMASSSSALPIALMGCKSQYQSARTTVAHITERSNNHMGIFSRSPKTPKTQHCDVCNAVYTPEEGRPHIFSHIAKISVMEPVWLPDTLRSEALGEYTFRCDRCNSFPAMHWPSEGGAFSGLNMHLAAAHNAGILNASVTGVRPSVQFNMFPVQEPETTASVWVPTVAMSSARPVVFTLAQAPAMNDRQVRSAIAELVRLSETPPAQTQRIIGSGSDVLTRPWEWLGAVMRDAQDSGDHALAAAGLLWALHWSAILVPKLDSNAFMELGLHPIPALWKAEILNLGLAATSSLPDDFVVAGDETGQMLAGVLARQASGILGQ
jgi:hypothetical protein